MIGGSRSGNIAPTYNQGFVCDLLDEGLFYDKIKQIKADVILHLAALSNPNHCELEPERSHQLNVLLTKMLAEYASLYDIPLVFASTDLVFDGEQGMYKEEDIPNPIMVYGRHKAEAEQVVLKASPNNTIVRLSLMFGYPATNNNYLKSWLLDWSQGRPIKAFTDEFRTAAYVKDVWRAIFILLEKKLKGIWHISGGERMSRYAFALKMAKVFGYREDMVLPSKQAEVEMPAPRAKDTSMSHEKLRAIGFEPMGTEAALNLIKVKIS